MAPILWFRTPNKTPLEGWQPTEQLGSTASSTFKPTLFYMSNVGLGGLGAWGGGKSTKTRSIPVRPGLLGSRKLASTVPFQGIRNVGLPLGCPVQNRQTRGTTRKTHTHTHPSSLPENRSSKQTSTTGREGDVREELRTASPQPPKDILRNWLQPQST